MAEEKYNLWTEVGPLRMPLCDALAEYLKYKDRPLNEIVSKIRAADKKYNPCSDNAPIPASQNKDDDILEEMIFEEMP